MAERIGEKEKKICILLFCRILGTQNILLFIYSTYDAVFNILADVLREYVSYLKIAVKWFFGIVKDFISLYCLMSSTAAI